MGWQFHVLELKDIAVVMESSPFCQYFQWNIVVELFLKRLSQSAVDENMFSLSSVVT
jgi:hypothetical protein